MIAVKLFIELDRPTQYEISAQFQTRAGFKKIKKLFDVVESAAKVDLAEVADQFVCVHLKLSLGSYGTHELLNQQQRRNHASPQSLRGSEAFHPGAIKQGLYRDFRALNLI